MSKSLGNFVTIRDLWATPTFGGRAWSADVLRLAMLRTHYRQPIDFTIRGLEEADRTMADFSKACAGAETSAPGDGFLAAMADDLNTPKALAELHALRTSDPAALRAGLALLGIGAEASSVATRSLLTPREAELLSLREASRDAKDWKESDRLRDELEASGIVVKDGKNGTTWERNL